MAKAAEKKAAPKKARAKAKSAPAKRLTVTVAEDVKHRHLPQVLALLDRGSMSPWVAQKVSGVFHRLEAH